MENSLNKFISFLNSSNDNLCDLENAKLLDEKIEILLNKNASTFFRAYFQNSADDLICLWDITASFNNYDTLPVVLLSSEGTPNIVIASNFDEFLSVLPYGIDFIVEIAEYFDEYNKYKDIFSPPDEMFSNDIIKKKIKQQSKKYSGQTSLINFISNDLGIPLTENPVTLIHNAFETFPNVQQWIDSNLK